MTRVLRILSLVSCILWLCHGTAFSQDSSSLYFKILHFPDKLFKKVDDKIADINARLEKQTVKYLERLSNEEAKLKRKLAKKDSTSAARIFDDAAQHYFTLQNKIKSKSGQMDTYRNKYIPHLDTLHTAFDFLQTTDGLIIINKAPEVQMKIKEALGKMDLLQGKFNQAEEIKKYLKQRRQFLQHHLEQFGLAKDLKKFKKHVYYYQSQVEEYRNMFDNPSILEAKAIELLKQSFLFRNFFANNSQLASLFIFPGSSSSITTAGVTGLQSRDAIQKQLLQRLANGPDVQQAIQQQVHEAQTQLNQLTNKINQLQAGSSDIEMPDFKLNNQKTKSIRNRLEFGSNLQTVKANNFFPNTSDIGLSLSYNLNDKSSIGAGGNYKLGLGRGWNNIALSHQGVGIRSFIDYKLKGKFFISGGYEQNYKTLFNSINQLKNKSGWQSSGLLGLSKKYTVNKNMKGNVQLLWDFLSYQQTPRTQALLFRVGYTFSKKN